MRTLILLRHAKSEYPLGVADHERPLSDRGRRDAPVAARWLAENAPDIDRAVVSSARRTQQTWEAVAKSLPDLPMTIEPRIYEASVRDLRAMLAETPAETSTVLVIGHNPGLEDLAGELINAGDPAARRALSVKYPTSAIAVMRTDDDWTNLQSTELISFAVPRG